MAKVKKMIQKVLSSLRKENRAPVMVTRQLSRSEIEWLRKYMKEDAE